MYGNGTVCNMGNETGGIQITLVADLKYNDLKGVVQSGQYEYPALNDYLYDSLKLLTI